MEIKLTITSPDLHDAILALAMALETAGTPFKSAAIEKPVEASNPVEKAPEPQAEVKEEPVKAYKLEDVRKLAMEKSKKDRNKVKDAISAVGAGKVTEIAEEKYPEFVSLLEAI